MDGALLLQYSQYVIPVGIVLLCAILVFVFGFKKAEQPPFAQLSSGSDVDRKLAKKRGKIRDKRATNGQVASEKTSPSKKTAPSKTDGKKNANKTDDADGKLKEQKQEENKNVSVKKDKKEASTKINKENKIEQVKNKKNLKNLAQEKPIDYDDGDWEQAYSRKDKKNKKKEDETPLKKNKKSMKKADLIDEPVPKLKELNENEIKIKDVTETEKKESKEKDDKKDDIILTSVSGENVTKEKELQKNKDQCKADKIEKEDKKGGKTKKVKKPSEGESILVSVPSTPKTDNKPSEKVSSKQANDKENLVEKSESHKPETVQEKNTAAFDELGDVWTEAKPQKKSKKKARKDN